MSPFHSKENNGYSDSRNGVKKVKVCKLCARKEKIDYKNIQFLSKFINDRGKILPRKATGLCEKHQKEVVRAIKTARQMALLPYVDENMR
mgnify:CR=1 FL=1|uniref:Small ribosomal subunit protein bS18 n=1 Tax=candidate division WOR-3 bacterium TaxID=2052148 RepID=A0A7C3N6X0_UNCW3